MYFKMNLNEEKKRILELAGVKKAPLTLQESEEKIILEGMMANIAAGLGLVLATFTSALGQTNVDKLKYSQDKRETIEKALEDPAVQSKLKEFGVQDNNIQKQIKNLKGRKITGYDTRIAKTDKDLQRYLKMGYHLTAVDVDTVITILKKEAPEQTIESVQLKMNEETMFESGRFMLSGLDAQNIQNTLDSIQESGSALLGVTIISSTDKQGISPRLQNILKSEGYSPNNQGLSQARNNGVKVVIESLGVDSSIINQVTLAEKGNQTIDQSARYVVAIFDVVKNTQPAPAESPEVKSNINTAYTLIKAKVKRHKDRETNLSLCRMKSKNYRKGGSPVDCYFQMQMHQK
jgi:hypothetical protein